MTTEPEKKKGTTRRDFLMGAGAGVVIGAVVVAGVEEGIRIPGLPKKTTTVTGPTSTVPGPTTTTTVTVTPPPVPMTADVVTLTVNGVPQTLEVQANWSLLEVLRYQLKLFGAKEGCNRGNCGACTVIIDGNAINSCQVLAIEAAGRQITTIESLSENGSGVLDPVQAAFVKHEAAQCGYCTPAMVMSAKALLAKNPSPTVAEIQEAMAGNLCICGNYEKIVEAIQDVAGTASSGGM